MADHVRDESESAPLSNFPQDPSEFDNDPRISFSKLDDKFILEADDGQEYEYDNALKRWIPTVSACARKSSLCSSHWLACGCWLGLVWFEGKFWFMRLIEVINAAALRRIGYGFLF